MQALLTLKGYVSEMDSCCTVQASSNANLTSEDGSMIFDSPPCPDTVPYPHELICSGILFLLLHVEQVSRRRALSWEQGPTGVEWVLAATHQVSANVHPDET